MWTVYKNNEIWDQDVTTLHNVNSCRRMVDIINHRLFLHSDLSTFSDINKLSFVLGDKVLNYEKRDNKLIQIDENTTKIRNIIKEEINKDENITTFDHKRN
jgi:hypothetical protein